MLAGQVCTAIKPIVSSAPLWSAGVWDSKMETGRYAHFATSLTNLVPRQLRLSRQSVLATLHKMEIRGSKGHSSG